MHLQQPAQDESGTNACAIDPEEPAISKVPYI